MAKGLQEKPRAKGDKMSIFMRFLLLVELFFGLMANAEFRDIRIFSSQSADVHLSTIDADPRFRSIHYEALRMVGDTPFPDLHASSNDTVQLLDFRFPSLTIDQFQFLKRTYGGGRSQLQFQIGKVYFLSDFLPPFAAPLFSTRILFRRLRKQPTTRSV